MEEEKKSGTAALRREMEAMRLAYEEKIRALEEKIPQPISPQNADEAFLEKQKAWLNEYVEIRLFRDNEKYKDDVYVAINGKNCVIRRGVWTRIRRKFALLLDQSEIQDLRTAELMEKEATRFANESERHMV